MSSLENPELSDTISDVLAEVRSRLRHETKGTATAVAERVYDEFGPQNILVIPYGEKLPDADYRSIQDSIKGRLEQILGVKVDVNDFSQRQTEFTKSHVHLRYNLNMEKEGIVLGSVLIDDSPEASGVVLNFQFYGKGYNKDGALKAHHPLMERIYIMVVEEGKKHQPQVYIPK